MLPANQLDDLPDGAALRDAGVVYAYRRGRVLVTFRRAPVEIARDIALFARRIPAAAGYLPAPAAAQPVTNAPTA